MTEVNGKIECKLCGAQVHVMQKHLLDNHPEYTPASYQEEFPGAPMLSDLAKQKVAESNAAKAAAAAQQAQNDAGQVHMAASAAPAASVASVVPRGTIVKKPLHEVFDLGAAKAALSAKGTPIPISVLTAHDHQDMVPEVSSIYVYDINELKNVILGLECSIPVYVHGHKGTGKSELLAQVAARTNRPQIRVQHTANTEESHIVGQWTVKGGETVFALGPLAEAMKHGWIYCADEYDFGMPSVLAVYQPVLEGKALVIKEAPPELRIIKPHRDFRFVATGNTNGSGDETGLYQGTLIQNSANYDRFGMVIHKKYMDKKAEVRILMGRCGLTEKDAEKMVEFATTVREAYDGAKLSDTISPRTMIYASEIGVKRGSFREGLALSFLNKLTTVDREVADGLAQRIFS
ncbi:MoxR family ATPase [Duganella sp. FT27W]|uniref:AAA family ATPase n=1 Tax=Duganella sp. FT27W TaxID=2654636 RepID=UPI00128B8B9D|nr:MoxR family ATPase [Duganella sp. FT27W]MPQ56339.1 AAA domain-containing protein [Duganella sp. FT27W]